jgi:hypothetical protein
VRGQQPREPLEGSDVDPDRHHVLRDAVLRLLERVLSQILDHALESVVGESGQSREAHRLAHQHWGIHGGIIAQKAEPAGLRQTAANFQTIQLAAGRRTRARRRHRSFHQVRPERPPRGTAQNSPAVGGRADRRKPKELALVRDRLAPAAHGARDLGVDRTGPNETAQPPCVVVGPRPAARHQGRSGTTEKTGVATIMFDALHYVS